MASALALIGAALVGAGVGPLMLRAVRRKLGGSGQAGVTRLAAHLAASTAIPKFTPAKSASLRRDVQEHVQNREAAHDLEVLDRLLRDLRDLTSAEEAIFWRWVEARQTLVPSAWSTEDAARPAFFNVRAWGALVRWSAEERELQLAGDIDGFPEFASAPVLGLAGVYGVLTVTSSAGLRLDREGARAWMPRLADQVGALVQLFDLRSEYGRHMRQNAALLDAVHRLHGHRSGEALAAALCETARDATSAASAGLVRWNAAERHGVIQAIVPAGELDAGFHVTADSLVGEACEQGTALILVDARSATRGACPYGGLAREVGSVIVIPIKTDDHVIGAIIIEGKNPNDVGAHESKNLGLLAAVARGPLEIIWEIEEVSLRARTDGLTGLANRRHFDEQLRRVVAETDRFGGACSLILIDLDHFKAVNDEHGHDAGDAVLRHAAQLLSEAIRTVDVCARYGGEEIAVLLPQTAQAGAVELAERLRQTLASRSATHANAAISVTASFGVATYPQPVPYGDWLVSGADKALYEAKAAGRNCVKIVQTSQVSAEPYRQR